MSNQKQEEVKLLQLWASPFAIRVVLALELKGISYEILEQDMSNRSPLLLESNPVHKKIPVLIHNGKPICESAIIVQYLDENWPENMPLLPKDPYERAQARFWADFIDNKFFKSFLPGLRSAKDVVQANEDLAECCKHLENELSKGSGTFFGGNHMNFVDVCLAPFVVWLKASEESFGIKLPPPDVCPKLHKLFDGILDHPVSKTALPSVEKVQEYGRSVFARYLGIK